MRTLHALAATLCVVFVVASVPAPALAHVNHVSADAQVSQDGRVIVESAYIAADGYLAVQRDDGGDPGEVIGYRSLASGDGFQTEVEVAVDAAAWREWDGPTTVHLTLRNDDGDGEFDPADDAIIQSFGQPAEAVITLAKGDRAAVSARDFSPVRAENGTVIVRYAALPTNGHLVVENASDGRTIGSVALDAGVHRNVSVPFDGTGEAQPVRAVLYRDDDGSFDGDEAPVTVDDAPVATSFTVREQDGESNATTTPLVTTATPFPNDTATTTSTDTATASTTATASATPTDTGGQAGFGVVVAGVAALLAGVALARRDG